MKTYLVGYDPLDSEPNGYYVRMNDVQAKDLRGLFKALEVEKVLREWRIEDVETLAIPYRDFVTEAGSLMEMRPGKPKDWFPGLRADRD